MSDDIGLRGLSVLKFILRIIIHCIDFTDILYGFRFHGEWWSFILSVGGIGRREAKGTPGRASLHPSSHLLLTSQSVILGAPTLLGP